MHHVAASPSPTVPPGLQGGSPAAEASAMSPLLLPDPARRHAMIALPSAKRHVRTARHFILTQLTRWGVTEEDRHRIELIVGELAGNSARHGRAEMTVHLTLTDQDLRIDVLDTGQPIHPRPRPTRPRDECGRGLGIVSHLADWTDTRHLRHGRHARAGLRVALEVCTAA